MKRFALTLIVTATAWGAYRLYAQFLGPLTAATIVPPTLEISTVEPDVQPLDFTADTSAPSLGEWTKKATYRVKHGDAALLYFDRYEDRRGPEGEGLVDVEPFALVWRGTGEADETPYVFTCDSARITFEREFKVGGSNAGRMKAGRLNGHVRIEGPNGLVIDGRNCVFDEATHQLYSDEPLTFRYTPQDGEFRRVEGEGYQLQIDLTPTTSPVLGRDMPRVSGVNSIVLRRNVRLDFVSIEDGQERRTRVTSAGPFTYDFPTRTARFDERVQVTRPTQEPGESLEEDTLVCRRLALQFEEATNPNASPGEASTSEKSKTGSPLGRLTFRLLRATGDARQPVVVKSDKGSFRGRMMDLAYDAAHRALAMVDLQTPNGVELTHEKTTLFCPAIRVTHDEGQKVTSAQCLQAGFLEASVSEQTSETSRNVRAMWKKQLWMEPRPDAGETVIALEGEAAVVQPGEYGILCDKLTLWLSSADLENDLFRRSSTGRAGTSAAKAEQSLPVKRALAEGNVAMAGRRFQIETSRLDAAFQEGTLRQAGAGNGGLTDGLTGGKGASAAEEPIDEQPWVVRANSIEARIVHQRGETLRADVAEIVGVGKIDITQAAAEPAAGGASETPALSVTGAKLHLLNEGGIEQTLHLTGAPAHLRRNGVHIEGDELLFDRKQNSATVVGKGLMQIPIRTGLNGEPLETPTQLDVHWTRQMSFDGLTAKFTEGVRARFQDSVMRCDEMHVTVSRRVDFSASRPDTRGAEIDTVRCLNGVDFEYYQWEQNDFVVVTKGRAAELEMSYGTGEFHAQGPGYFDGWQRTEQRRVDIEPSSAVRANQPIEASGLPWEYTKVHFAGKITGNFQKRRATLHDRVQVIHAPVKEPLQVFLRDDLSKDTPSSRNAAWLGCDELQIAMTPPPARTSSSSRKSSPTERHLIQLLAIGKLKPVELEGRLFQATADTLTYDETTRLFTLRGLGTNKASVSYQERPAAPYHDTNGQLIQFNPSRRSGSVQGSDGAFSQ